MFSPTKHCICIHKVIIKCRGAMTIFAKKIYFTLGIGLFKFTFLASNITLSIHQPSYNAYVYTSHFNPKTVEATCLPKYQPQHILTYIISLVLYRHRELLMYLLTLSTLSIFMSIPGTKLKKCYR